MQYSVGFDEKCEKMELFFGHFCDIAFILVNLSASYFRLYALC